MALPFFDEYKRFKKNEPTDFHKQVGSKCYKNDFILN